MRKLYQNKNFTCIQNGVQGEWKLEMMEKQMKRVWRTRIDMPLSPTALFLIF